MAVKCHNNLACFRVINDLLRLIILAAEFSGLIIREILLDPMIRLLECTHIEKVLVLALVVVRKDLPFG